MQKRVKYKTKFDQNTNLYSLIKDLVVGKYVGFVSTVGDGVVKATGLRGVAYGEVVYFPSSNIRGLAYNLNKDDVDILVLGEDRNIKTGDLILATKPGLYVPVSKKLLGRIISPLGEVLDDKDKISEISAYANINMKAPGIIYRQKINEPLFTGIKVLDSLIPIGKGQRELIIGDKGTGKTSLAFDIILNQKFENEKDFSNLVLCIYVSIGQKRSNVKKFFENLEKFDASWYTVIVSATSSDSASLQYLAPYSGCAIAEYFMSFANSLIIYDDLSQHAIAYRQISLLLRRPPGREAYPGDIFYLHSRLLERSLKLHKDYGGRSMTALPIVETLFGDVTAYIPTNVISITDGQIFLDKSLYIEGILPAINIGLSVSRVGSAAQVFAMKKIAGSLKLELAQYREIKDFIKFGSDLDEETLKLIKKGKLLTLLLKQDKFMPVSVEDQILLLYGGLNNYLENINNNNDLNLFLKKLKDLITKNLIFKTHYNLLRNDDYFKEYGNMYLNTIFSYYNLFK